MPLWLKSHTHESALNSEVRSQSEVGCALIWPSLNHWPGSPQRLRRQGSSAGLAWQSDNVNRLQSGATYAP